MENNICRKRSGPTVWNRTSGCNCPVGNENGLIGSCTTLDINRRPMRNLQSEKKVCKLRHRLDTFTNDIFRSLLWYSSQKKRKKMIKASLNEVYNYIANTGLVKDDR